MDSGQFDLYYQPIHCLRSKGLKGVEALLRWHHPVRGLLLPEDFLDEVEKSGLMIELGWWTLRHAALQMAEWRSLIQMDSSIFVSVDLFDKQFSSPGLVPSIAAMLEDQILEPGWLRLEMTETVIMEDSERVATRFHELTDLGVGIMLDDFGTGYSSAA